MDEEARFFRRVILLAVLGAFIFMGACSTIYTVDEGHVGIVKQWGKVVSQTEPGIHMKWPIAEKVYEMEVRQRKNVEELAAATTNQLPVKAVVSINWTVNRADAYRLYIEYGGLDQFENRIIDPKLRNAVKAALAQFTAEQLIRNRQQAVAFVMDNMVRELEQFPVTVNSPQLEQLELPPTYLEAVKQKEEALQNAKKEEHNLTKQRLVAQQAVNSAEANAEAKKLEADAEAYKVKTVAEAEANAVKMLREELKNTPLYVEYVRAK